MEYLIHLLILVGIYAILGLSLNLVVGYTGMLSVTHAAFYGIGAYASALLMVRAGWNFFLSVITAIVVTAIAGYLIGWILSRLKGDYFALGSFGFNIIIFSIFLNWNELTRGPLGIPGIPRPDIFGFVLKENFAYLILVGIIFAAIYWLSKYITNSSYGRVLKAIREDEKAISVFGYNTLHFKLTIFTIGAGMAAVAGALFASYITFIDPYSFVLFESIFILAIIILGGLGTLRGSVIGALILILLPELLRFVGMPPEIAAQMRQVIYGIILVILMIYRPQGIIGEYKI